MSKKGTPQTCALESTVSAKTRTKKCKKIKGNIKIGKRKCKNRSKDKIRLYKASKQVKGKSKKIKDNLKK